ncbi:MAG: hypothetical protein F9K35_06995 [Burkholderiaceae bacterium]|nr:MAG: hypothetical protein F9K35_06995 [Burkholderiaceae bacterium]
MSAAIPFRAWLQSQKWDGKARLKTWLPKVLGPSKDRSWQEAQYLALVGRYVVMAHVARVMEPGCKFDHIVALDGPQGVGKSLLVRTLIGAGYHCDEPFRIYKGTLKTPDLRDVLAYEVAELEAFNRADASLIKGFLTSACDFHRRPYSTSGLRNEPRQCVIWFTSGHADALTEGMNTRRFWPVTVHQPINAEWLQKHRAQLFAEALHRYRKGKRFTPSALQEFLYFDPVRARREGDAA